MGQPGTNTGAFEADEFTERGSYEKANESGEYTEGFHRLSGSQDSATREDVRVRGGLTGRDPVH
jgi:hypothetical protein